MRKGIKKKNKQKGREEAKTKSFYFCYSSLTEVRAGLRPELPTGKRKSDGFEKRKPTL